MNAIFLASLVFLAAAAPEPSASKRERFLAAEGIPVASAPAAPASTTDKAWNSVAPTHVALAPQGAIRLTDKDANAAATGGSLAVRAVATGKDLAVLLEWSDATDNGALSGETDQYADGAALQFPVAWGAGTRLPYIGMGDAEQNVLVHFARGGTTRTAVAAGFGSLTRTPIGWVRTEMRYAATTKTWRALFVRPLATAEHRIDAALVPIAFAAWDGARDQRGGNKALSGWRFLRMPGKAADAAYVEQLAYGYGPGEIGDANRGKAFVESVCISCHRVGAKAFAPVDLAPELTHVGTVSSYGYLRDSLVAPSTVLVPNLNRNRHQDRNKPRDANGAYPNADLGSFAILDDKGHATSRMPAFATMPPEQLADVLAYLKSLGAQAPAPAPAPAPAGVTP